MMKWVRWTHLQAWGAGPGHGEVGLAWDSPGRGQSIGASPCSDTLTPGALRTLEARPFPGPPSSSRHRLQTPLSCVKRPVRSPHPSHLLDEVLIKGTTIS